MVADDMDEALRTAEEAKLLPTIFKIRTRPDGLRPSQTAKRKGIPIDPTSQRSHLLCDGGRKIMIEGDWA